MAVSSKERVRKWRALHPSESRAINRRAKQKARSKGPVLQAEISEGDDPISWIESRLKVPSGPKMGEPFVVHDWQREFLKNFLNREISEGCLSVSRKNGKTGLIAATLLCYLCGPLNIRNGRVLVSSLTGRLACELREAVEQTARSSGRSIFDAIRVLRAPFPGSIEGRQGLKVEILASDKATGHSSAADLVVIDEGGLMTERDRSIWSTLLNATSGREGKFLVISIRSDGPMLNELYDRRNEPHVYFQEHSAAADCDITDERAWAAGNPGLESGIKSVEWMRRMANRAVGNAAETAIFRSQNLNCPGVSVLERIVDLSDFRNCVVPPENLPPRDDFAVMGLDLGGTLSLTAAAIYWPRTGRMECYAVVGGVPSLSERGIADGVGNRYELMQERGELMVSEGSRLADAKAFIRRLLNDLGGTVDLEFAADRYRRGELEDMLGGSTINWRGLGWKSASEDVRSFQRAVATGEIRLLENLLLSSALASSTVLRDPAGNQKISKVSRDSRIDALQATILAVGLGERRMVQEGAGGMEFFSALEV